MHGVSSKAGEAKTNIWYRLGYAWERARPGPADGGERSGRERRPTRPGNGSAPSDARKPASSLLERDLIGEAAELARRTVAQRVRRAPVRGDLGRAALAGAGAALAARALASLLAGDATPEDDDPGLGIELVQGATEGLALAVLVRHLPGGRLLQAGLCGAARYAAASRGGLPHVVRPIAPPILRALAPLAPEASRHRGPLEHAAFAVAFVLLHPRRTPATD